MRRISLALALLGAVAGAGCSGGKNPSSSGSNRGVPGSTFTVLVRGEAEVVNPATGKKAFIPNGGLVTGTGINCGFSGGVASFDCSEDFPWGTADAPTTVTLTATPSAPNTVFAFAGDCSGNGACTVTGNADRMVLVRFAPTAEGLGTHPDYSSSALHGPAFRTNALQCTQCHGATLEGQGIAVSCFTCHTYTFPPTHAETIVLGGHFDPAGAAWGDHTSGWGSSCTRCHTNAGFRDYVGADGSDNHLDGTFKPTNQATSTFDACLASTTAPCAPGAYSYGPLKCDSCHNAESEPSTGALTTVLFPSMLPVVTTDGASAVCSQCHQGRESTTSVNAKIGSTADDMVIGAPTGISFVNPHYLGAAGTLNGDAARMWAQYAGQSYEGPFTHGGLNGCTYCHDAHSGEVEIAKCGQCHTTAAGAKVATVEELAASRQVYWDGDIDGDGDTTEGIRDEITGLEDTLYLAIKAYATNVVGTSIVYDGASHPYYYVDANGDGVRDVTETTAFKQFTPRLLRATFNNKWAHAEAGAWAHNTRYVVQVLYDSINDLNAGLGANAVPFNGTVRDGFAPAQLATLGGHFLASGHNTGTCARCHAGDGFRDYIGADGSADNHLAAGKDPASAATTEKSSFASGFNCVTCHNAATALGGGGLDSIRFPNAKIVATDGYTAICGQCHTGARDAYNAAQLAIQIKAVADDVQLPTADNKVVRAHYLPAASTLFGPEAANWNQYAGKFYSGRNQHGGAASCTDCHDAHSGALPADADIAASCGVCHYNEAGAAVSSFLELEEVRQLGFEGDIDGDGTAESLKAELDGLAALTYAAIQAYAQNVAGTAICAADNRYYIVSNAAVACNVAPNTTQYNKFTPRLLRAAYNYLIWQNDVGAWAHNPRYAIEVLFDTIDDLNAGLVGAGEAAVANGYRTFAGHFGAATAEAPAGGMQFRDWDDSATVPANCSQCHAGEQGLVNYLADPFTNTTNTPVTGMQCTTCHEFAADMKTLRAVASVAFPPRKTTGTVTKVEADFAAPADLLCATCHTGREDMDSIDTKIAALVDPVNNWSASFTNPHYFGAAATVFGADVAMMYQYTGNTYAGKAAGSCVACHAPKDSRHSFEADPNDASGRKVALATLADALYDAIAAYSQAAGKAVCYSTGYPYWFLDNGASAGDGVCQADETTGAKFNGPALKAAFNYKWSQAEGGAWAHNYDYMGQILIDSIVDLGGTPPAVTPAVAGR